MRDCGGAQYSLPVTTDTHHVTLGEACVHTHPAAAARHETASLPDGQAQVFKHLQNVLCIYVYVSLVMYAVV